MHAHKIILPRIDGSKSWSITYTVPFFKLKDRKTQSMYQQPIIKRQSSTKKLKRKVLQYCACLFYIYVYISRPII